MHRVCLLRAMGKKKKAWEAFQRYSSPAKKHEMAQQKIADGDLNEAFEIMETLTAHDISLHRSGKICFDCQSAENRVLEDLLKKSLYAREYELASKIIEIFPRFELNDEDVSQASAQQIYNQLKAMNGKVDRSPFCEEARKRRDLNIMLVCALVHKKTEEVSDNEKNSLWMSYLNACGKARRSCYEDFLQSYSRELEYLPHKDQNN